jgi:outer membrane lipoprotein-sorting protein
MRWHKGIIAIWLAVSALSLGQLARAADDQSARANVDRVAQLFVSKSCIATIERQIVKADFQRTISMKLWSLGDTYILVRLLSPQEDAGTAILKAGNKAWTYLPKSNRTVEMPATMMMTPLMGSHFTLDDLVGQARLTEDYGIATSFAGERDGAMVSEYTLTPKPAAAVVWGKIVLEIRQSDLMPVWERYYDEDGKPVRELAFSDYKTESGRLVPTRLVMRPLDQPGEETTITYENVAFDVPISEDTFSLEKLR